MFNMVQLQAFKRMYFPYSIQPNSGTYATEYLGCWMMSSLHESVEDKTSDSWNDCLLQLLDEELQIWTAET